MMSCAFTGHRPQKFPWKHEETDPRCVALKSVLKQEITALAESGVTDYFSGMAEGTDLWAAQIVLALREENPRLRLRCVLPYPGQADSWSDSARELYFSILQVADSLSYVSREYDKDCMLRRNRCLAESAGLLLAVYNGTRRSGTGATVHYAQKLGKEIVIIDPITRTVSHIRESARPVGLF